MTTADQVASVVIARNSRPWTDAMSLQKLVYYTQAWHLAITGHPLFPESFQAYRDGPVVPEVWRARRDRSTRSRNSQNVDNIELDELSSAVIDLVISTYGSMSAEELSALTHEEGPWLEARGDLPEDARCESPLSFESMARFYRSHRLLGGRSAADLAAGGVHVQDPVPNSPIDVDAILRDLPGPGSADDSPWGSGNLENSARRERPRRTAC